MTHIPQELTCFVEQHHHEFVTFVSRRLNRQLQSRLSAEDIVQDAYLDAFRDRETQKIPEGVSLVRWMMGILRKKLAFCYRQHFQIQSRSLNREAGGNVPVDDSNWASAVGAYEEPVPTADEFAQDREARQQLTESLERLSPTDRDILSLRLLNGVSNQEAAQQLNLSRTAASNRYQRALKRLQSEQ